MSKRDPELPNVAVLVGNKGRGSNMAALATACMNGRVPARVSLVVAPGPSSPALLRAEALGIHTEAIPKGDDYAKRLLEAFERSEIDWICLAGFMFLLPEEVVDAYRNRILNIHPALLPKFGGKGMYGLAVHEAVLASGESESGCTVHFVNERYDEGAILFQQRCPVLPDDTPETLADRVLDLEHVAYAEALRRAILAERN